MSWKSEIILLNSGSRVASQGCQISIVAGAALAAPDPPPAGAQAATTTPAALAARVSTVRRSTRRGNTTADCIALTSATIWVRERTQAVTSVCPSSGDNLQPMLAPHTTASWASIEKQIAAVNEP